MQGCPSLGFNAAIANLSHDCVCRLISNELRVIEVGLLRDLAAFD
jgi:hypothetical protein